MNNLPTNDRIGIAYVIIAVMIVLNGITAFLPETREYIGIITRSNERSLIEFSEAILWFLSFLGFTWLAFREIRDNAWGWRAFYYAVFAILSFAVCGEEISWGQHLGFFDAPESVKEMNAQGEFNLHNLKLGVLLGLSPDHWLYPYTQNAGQLVSPLFQLTSVFMWGIIPLVLTRLFPNNSGPSIFARYPKPARATSIFVIAGFVTYLLVDKLAFDIAEIIELCIAMTAFMVMLDRRRLLQS